MNSPDFLSTKSGTVSTDRKQIRGDYARKGWRTLGELGEGAERNPTSSGLFDREGIMSSHLILGAWDQGYSAAPTQMLSETEPSLASLVTGHIVDTLVVRMIYDGQTVVIERFGRRVNPTSELEFSQLVADFQIEKSSPRSYPTDNGAKALRDSEAIVYQVVVRAECHAGATTSRTLYRAQWRLWDWPAPAERLEIELYAGDSNRSSKHDVAPRLGQLIVMIT
jgi:hypothetical protein